MTIPAKVDLNIPLIAVNSSLKRKRDSSENTIDNEHSNNSFDSFGVSKESLLNDIEKLGWCGIAWNVKVIDGKLSSDRMCNNLMQPPMKNTKNIKEYSRLTLTLNDAYQQLTSSNPVIASYDIFAVVPTSEKTFAAACQTLEVDIISLEEICYANNGRLPFTLKPNLVRAAIKRGICFEISYGGGLERDSQRRRAWISFVSSIVRASGGQGKGIFFSFGGISSELSINTFNLRKPEHMIILGQLFGIKHPEKLIDENIKQVIFHAKTRNCTYRAAVAVKDNLLDIFD